MTFAFALATTLLAAAPSPSAAPPAASTDPGSPSPRATTVATPSGAGDGYDVRRTPDTAPRMLPPAFEAVTIRNSGSTNLPGFSITIRPDGSADVVASGATERATVAAPQTRWLFQKIREAGALDALPSGRCMKSASFGSSLTVAFGGRVSPDLNCGESPVERELARTADIIVAQLGVGGARARGRRPG
ncbi:MAG: hypothetical protein NVSMB59_09860 [Vulcanimicrobiaceae bacterium]